MYFKLRYPRYMEKHQIHFEKKFYLDKQKGYWISTTSPKIRAHVWVWINSRGSIPKGCHIHHRDGNKSNNSIENLELMSQSEHLKLHMITPERRKKSKETADKYRHLTKAWHASEEGRAWHKAHGILAWIERKEITITCKVCQKQAKTKTLHQQFCSNACKSKWRRDQGLDDIERKCPSCQTSFKCSKYSKTIYCSRACVFKK